MEKKLGVKYDSDKPRMELLPFDALEEVAKVLTTGSIKYADDNWRIVPEAIRRYKGALLRHYAAIYKGELRDHETGLLHSAHLACCALFLVSLQLEEENKKLITINSK